MSAGFAVVGPIMSGKSQFVSTMIRNWKAVMTRAPNRVVYCYGEWRMGFQKLEEERLPIEFIHGMNAVFERRKIFRQKKAFSPHY